MRDPERPLEQRLRAALRDEAAQAGATVSSARLHAAANARRRRERQWWTAAAAAVGIVAVAGAVTVGSLLPSNGVANPSPSDVVGSPTAPPTALPSPTGIVGAPPYPIDVPLRCGGISDPGLPAIVSRTFLEPPDGDFAGHPSAPALRAAAGSTVGELALPASGWRLASASSVGALYLAAGGADLDGSLVFVHLAVRSSNWAVEATGPCRPELDESRTAMAAHWEVAPGAVIGPASTSLAVLVTERACASGKAPGDRLRQPVVRYGDDWVAIGFTVTMQPGAQDCPGNPAVPVLVTLDQPLGNRVLLDVGQFPFAKVMPPEPLPTLSGSDLPAPPVLTLGEHEVEVLRIEDEREFLRRDDLEEPSGTDSWLMRIACTGEGSIDVMVDGIGTAYACPLEGQVDEFAPDLIAGLILDVRATGSLRWSLLASAVDIESRGGWIPPRASLSGPEWTAGDIVEVGGYAGCGWSWVANGEQSSTSCGPSWMSIPTVLRVRPGAEVALTLDDGWTIMGVTGALAAQDDILPSRSPAQTPIVRVEAGSDVVFAVPEVGDWGVRLDVTGERAGDTFSVPYYFRVIVDA